MLSISEESFATMIQEKSYYVDKTALIADILRHPNKNILITRPRRWGKTLNLSMLECFFADTVKEQPTRDLFTELNIANIDQGKWMTHQGQHPVIIFSLKSIDAQDLETFEIKIKSKMSEIFMKHRYLLSSSKLLPFEPEAIMNILKKKFV